jgi:hypothetical protein
MFDNRIFNEIKKLNSNQKINSIFDSSFNLYGRVLDNTPYTNLCNLLQSSTAITEKNVYVANETKLFDLDAHKAAKNIFGGLDIQIGYCNGMNQTLNGMEYHKSPEVIIAGTDLLLFLAKPSDLKDFSTLNSSCAKVFFAPIGSAFSLNTEILHLSPSCVHQSGFKSVIILPKDTNLDLDEKLGEDNEKESLILFKKNKWIITHKDRKPLVSQGVKIGITGINSRLIPIND